MKHFIIDTRDADTNYGGIWTEEKERCNELKIFLELDEEFFTEDGTLDKTVEEYPATIYGFRNGRLVYVEECEVLRSWLASETFFLENNSEYKVTEKEFYDVLDNKYPNDYDDYDTSFVLEEEPF